MRVAGVGFNCIDVYDKLNKYYPTGNSVDFVVHMSRFGMKTSMVSAVGTDCYGELMLDLLRREKVDVSHLRVEKGETAIFKMDLNGNDRVHREKIEGVMAGFALYPEDVDFVLQHDVIHTNLSGKVIDRLSPFREKGLRVVFDFSTRMNKEIAEPVLPDVDYAFFSSSQDNLDVLNFMKWAKSLGPKIIIVTMGDKGSIAYDGQSFFREGIKPVDVVNTVGAGDSFCAGFMYGILCGWSLPESLKHGSAVAAEVVGKFEPY